MSSNIVPLIKERLSIVDVLSAYITVEGAGKNFKARCPFHNEKTPSFFISPERNSYYCFGCGQKGDIFSFVEHFEGTDFSGALKILANKAGVSLVDVNKNRESKDEMDRMYECMEEATNYFQAEFLKHPEARMYLLERGVSDESIKNFRIGYVSNAWRNVSDYLLKKGFSQKEIEGVGLIKTKEDSFYDRFRGRIMFPISDSSGRVIAFSGRIFGRPDENEAKYLNSPDTKLFNKSNILFGIDKAKNDIRIRGYSIVVEGQMDLVLCHQAGFTNTVATSGTALSDSEISEESKVNSLGLIKRLSNNVIFAFDGDNAGVRACGRASLIALGFGMQVKVAVLPAGKDPADIIRENAEDWKNIVKNAVNIINFYLGRINAETNDLRLRGVKARDIIFPYLAMVQSSIEVDAYIQEISKSLGISNRAISEDFGNFLKTYKYSNVKVEPKSELVKNDSVSRRDVLINKIVGIYAWKKDDDFIQKSLNEFGQKVSKFMGESYVESILDSKKDELDSLSFETEMWYGGKVDTLHRDVSEVVLNLEEELIKEYLIGLSSRISQSNDALPKELIEQYQMLTQRVAYIKNSRLK
jgi:DNA primase